MPELDHAISFDQLAEQQLLLAAAGDAVASFLGDPGWNDSPEAQALGGALRAVAGVDGELIGPAEQALVDESAEWLVELAEELAEGGAGQGTATYLAELGRRLAEAGPDVPALGSSPSDAEIAAARVAQEVRTALGTIGSAMTAAADLATALAPSIPPAPVGPSERVDRTGRILFDVRISDVPEVAQLWAEARAAARTPPDLTTSKSARHAYDATRSAFVRRLVADNPVASKAREYFEKGGCMFLRDDEARLLTRMPVMNTPDLDGWRAVSPNSFIISGQHLDQVAHYPSRALDADNLVFMSVRDNVHMDKLDAARRVLEVARIRG